MCDYQNTINCLQQKVSIQGHTHTHTHTHRFCCLWCRWLVALPTTRDSKTEEIPRIINEVTPRYCNRDPVKMLSYTNSEVGISLAVIITLQALQGKYGLILTVLEHCTLLGYYKASRGNFLLICWDNLLGPSSGFKNPKESL